MYLRPVINSYSGKVVEDRLGLVQTQYGEPEEPEQAQVEFSIQSIEFSALSSEGDRIVKIDNEVQNDIV